MTLNVILKRDASREPYNLKILVPKDSDVPGCVWGELNDGPHELEQYLGLFLRGVDSLSRRPDLRVVFRGDLPETYREIACAKFDDYGKRNRVGVIYSLTHVDELLGNMIDV